MTTKPAPTPRFHIGVLARRSGHSVHTIRWYEAQGLMPNVGRDGGGRRVYVEEHLEHLHFLEHLRRTGMPIAGLRHFTDLSLQGWRSLEARRALLAEHRAAVEARIADLGRALDLIDQKADFYARWAAGKKRPPPLPPIAESKALKSGAPKRKRGSEAS